ncbi:MAG: TIGR03619 family F420-dependent LLM class oxidoreductase [Acidimicrobiales bacterium]|nr:TIGR03619 family F420-dependent LLM class oxidoreductase [Acidimicrobiales bacterium]
MRFHVATAYLPPEELGPIAEAADELGYHGFALSDHVINLKELDTRYPYTETGARRWEPFTPWVDPWVTIGHLAARTTQIRFFTNVFILPMRNPLIVAKTVGTAAVLSGGRVSLGIGMGWCEEEFDLTGGTFRQRGARADETIEILREVWAGDWTEHHGTHFDFPPLEMTPAPAERIPILVGGLSDAAMRRAARNDGWISDLMSTPEAGEARAKLDDLRAEIGATGDFSMIVSLNDAVTADDFRRAEEVGVTDLLTMPWAYYGGFQLSLPEKIDGLKRFAEDVLVHLAP